MRLESSRIDLTSGALARVLDFSRPADGALSAFFRDHPRMGQRDRAFVAETVYAVLRHLRSFTGLCAQCGVNATPRQLVLISLMRGDGRSLRDLRPALRPGEEDFLNTLRAASVDALTPAERHDLPDWLYQRLSATFAEDDLSVLMRALNRPASLDIRCNPLKLDRAGLVARLADDPALAGEPTPYSPYGLRLDGKPPVNRHPAFKDGSLEVQDEGSQLLAMLVAPKRGEMVMDFCAGAGGKTLLLGALMRNSGRLYACDVSAARLSRLKPRLARSGLSNVWPLAISGERDVRLKRLAGKLDRVLVDAPCSGLGTLRRNPDLKWRQTAESVDELTGRQASILASAATLVKPGGRLVYATCSLLPEENEGVADAFLEAHPEFSEVTVGPLLAAQGVSLDCGDRLHLRPDVHGCDGFFAVVMERQR